VYLDTIAMNGISVKMKFGSTAARKEAQGKKVKVW
jgi:hypothetical protein